MPGFYCPVCGNVYHAATSMGGGYVISPHHRWDPEGAAERERERVEARKAWDEGWADTYVPQKRKPNILGLGEAMDIWDTGYVPCDGGKIDIEKDRAP